MSGKLVIRSVHAENFGGLSGRHLDLPDESMVVIHGPNESGKSTLSELITWLLVGPSSNSNLIRTLGKADEILSGEMTGRLNEADFLARGNFKITPKSWEIAKASERIYQLNGPLTAEEWLRGLNDIDRATLQGIYRMWGQQLHDGGDADDEMRRAGLGAIAMSVDPRLVVRKLNDLAKPGSKLGEGDSSFNSISSELREVSQAVVLANNNIVEYNSKTAELAELESRGAGLREAGSELSRRRTNLESFKTLDEYRVAESEARAALRDLPTVPEKWLPVVGGIHRLRPVIETCGDQRRLVQGAQEGFDHGLEGAALASSTAPSEVIERFSISIHDTSAVGGAVSDLGHAQKSFDQSVESLDASAAKLAEAQSAATRAALNLGVDLDQVRAAPLDSAEQEFERAKRELAGINGEVSNAQEQVRLANATVAEASEAVNLAEARWEQFDAGMPAAEWRQGSGNRNGFTDGPSTVRRLAPVVALLVVAGVAAVLTQWLLAGMILIVAAIAWFVMPSPMAVVPDPSMGEAADQVSEARMKLDVVQSTLAGHRQTLAGKKTQLADAELVLLGIGRRFEITLPDDPAAVEGALAEWRNARSAAESLDKELDRHGEAERQFDEKSADRQEALERLDLLLTGFGLPAGIDPAAAESIAGKHVELLAQADRLLNAQAAAAAAEAELADILGPVAGDVSDWKLDDILKKAEDAVVTHNRYQDAAVAAEEAANRVAHLVGQNSELSALVDAGVDTVWADFELGEISHKAEEIREQQQELAEQTGVVKEDIKRLESQQQLADLRLQQGSLEEIRGEFGLELAARRLAALVLQHVADDYERKNQPELIRRTAALALTAAKEWSGVEVRLDGAGSSSLVVNLADGSGAVPVASLSTGARALLYLSLRVAMAEYDTERRGVALPLICDDPLVHIDDERASAAMGLLADASKSRQVVLFTCHERTVEVAKSMGVATHRM